MDYFVRNVSGIIVTRLCWSNHQWWLHQHSQITRIIGPTWGPPGSCRPQMGPMLAPWTLLSGLSLLGRDGPQCHLWGRNDHSNVVYLALTTMVCCYTCACQYRSASAASVHGDSSNNSFSYSVQIPVIVTPVTGSNPVYQRTKTNPVYNQTDACEANQLGIVIAPLTVEITREIRLK